MFMLSLLWWLWCWCFVGGVVLVVVVISRACVRVVGGVDVVAVGPHMFAQILFSLDVCDCYWYCCHCC